jgi:hypothetical protein
VSLDAARHEYDRDDEYRQWDRFRVLITENRDLFAFLWKYGDGNGGYVFSAIRDDLLANHLISIPAPPKRTKKKIPAGLRVSVFERDAYRCVVCGSHKSLCADHIYPESLGGQATFENLQTLCRVCNSKKGTTI